MSFRFYCVADFNEAYRTGRLTPSDVAERALAAVDKLDRREPPMRLFIALDADDVRAQAKESTTRFREGRSIGPFDGVPIAIKDEYDVQGYGTTCGTSFLGKTPATKDALAVARLRAAGAIIFGKTNMYELGMAASGVNPHHGAARNPYDPKRDTGGSSSGSAAVVAAGLTPIALGNDGGGSIRIPGSLCGVPGLKGTFGRVPTEGIALLCWSLEHAGPLASNVEDLALAFGLITDEKIDLPPMFGRARAPRIGICDSWWEPASVQVSAVVRAAIDRLRAGGAQIESIELPHVDLSTAVGFATFCAEGATATEAHLRADQPMSLPVRLSLDMARGLSAVSYVKAQRARALIARDFDEALASVDVIISPSTCITAPIYNEDAFAEGEVNEARLRELSHFTFPLNLTGLPAMQVPCGYDADGMPVGMQIVGRHGADLTTLSVAREVERTTTPARPQIWTDLLA